MSTLDDILSRAEEVRLSVRKDLTVKMSAPEAALAGAVAGPLGLAQYSYMANAAEQYRAASRGYSFTSIRPIAVKAADQALRVGVRSDGAMDRRKKALARLAGVAGYDYTSSTPYRHEMIIKSAPQFIKSAKQEIDVLDEHAVLTAFDDPNPYMTTWALMYCTAFSMEATGEAVWILDPQSDGLLNFWYVPRSWCEPVHTEDQLFKEWKISPPNATEEPEPIPSALVAHFFYPNPANPVQAHSALSAQALAINTDDEIQRSQYHLTKNIQRPSMLITLGELVGPDGTKGGRPELSDKQRQDIIQSVRRHYAEAARFGDPMVLDRVVDNVQPYMPGLADLDYNQGSMLTKARIEQGIGTNPIVTGQTGSNRAEAWVAHESINSIKVNPLLTNIGQTLTKKIPPITNDPTLIVWFDDAKAKDPDLKHKRVSLLAQHKAMTKGELRDYAETGDFEAVPRDDDDELIEGKQAPQPGQPGQPGKPGEVPGENGNPVEDKDNGKEAGDNDDADEKKPAKKEFDPYYLLEAIEYGKSLGDNAARIQRRKKKRAELTAKNCGTGSGGFKTGNTCGKGGGGIPQAIGGKGGWKKTHSVDTDYPNKKNSAAKWANKKVAKMEAMAADGDWAGLAAMDTKPKSPKPNKYQQAVHESHKKLMAAAGNHEEVFKLTGQAVKMGTATTPGKPTPATPPKGKTDGIPDASNWEKTGGQMGSNSGFKAKAPDGTEYYVKVIGEDRAKSELLASKLYEAAGSGTPELSLVMVDGQMGIASKWEKAGAYDNADVAHKINAQHQFATHAWLANWDAAGMTMDNQVVLPGTDTAPPKVKTVDVGGSLEYRAQGEKKGAAFGNTVSEWETMRDASKAPQAASIFSDMTEGQLAASASKVTSLSDDHITQLCAKYGPGSLKQKAALADKLIARRNDIAKKVNESNGFAAYQAAKEAGMSIETSEAVAKYVTNDTSGDPLSTKITKGIKKAIMGDEPEEVTPASGGPPVKVKTGQAKEMTTPNPATTAPVSLPPKPTANTTTNPSFASKIDEIQAAAQHAAETGDFSKLEAIKTSATSKQTYAKKKHQYKQACLEALAQGGKKPPAGVMEQAPTPKAAKPKIKPSEFPPDPDFVSSNAANVAANKKAVAELKALAEKGDIDGLKAHPGTPSPKLTEYKDALESTLYDQLHPPPPPKPLSKCLSALSNAHKALNPQSVKKATQRIWRFVTLGKANITPSSIGGSPPKGINESTGKWKEDPSAKQIQMQELKKHKASYNKLTHDEREAYDDYIDGGYSKQNAVIAGDQPGNTMQKQRAKMQARAMKKGAVPLPEGKVLYRGHDLSKVPGLLGDTKDNMAALKAQVGKVIQDPAMISSARTASAAWSGPAQWRMTIGPGVKGLAPPGQGESEIVLPPNTRYLIKSVKEVGGRVYIDAVIMPTEDSQYDALPHGS